ncbi:MAG: AAA family ATPase [Pseudomonadota bacterium]
MICHFGSQKFARPERAHRVPTRLRERVKDAGANLIWICGPPGSGKTTLCADVTRGEPTAWIRLDASDEDPALFFSALVEAFAQVGAQGQGDLPTFCVDYLANLGGFVRAFCASAFRGYERLPTLVIDEAQRVSDERLGDLLAAWWQNAPSELRTIVISRRRPPPIFVRHVLNRDIDVVQPAELRLTIPEVATVLGDGVESPRVQEIASRTDGWLTGVVVSEQNATNVASVEASLIALADYFDAEVLAPLKVGVVSDLCRIAWWPALKRDTRDAMGKAGRQTLEAWGRHGTFVDRHRDTDGDVLTLHPLLAHCLQRRAHQALSEQECQRVQTECATALLLDGQWVEAMDRWEGLGRFDAMAELLRSNAPALLAASGGLTVARWIDALPMAVRRRDPHLVLWRGLALLQRDAEEAREDLLEAARVFKREGRRHEWLVTLSHLSSSYFLECADAAPSVELTEDVDALAAEFESFEVSDEQALIATCVWMGLFLRQPDHCDLPLWEERLQRLLNMPISAPLRIRAAMLLAKHYYFRGEYQKIAPLAVLIRPLGELSELAPYAKQLWFITMLADAWTQGDYERARTLYLESRRFAQHSQSFVLELFVEFYAGIASMLATDYSATVGHLATIERNLSAARPMEVWCAFLLKSWHALVDGDPVNAVAFGETALRSAQQMNAVAFEGLAHAALGYAHAQRHDASKFDQQLSELRAVEERGGGPVLTFHRLLLEAAHLRDARPGGDFDAQKVRAAFRFGREHGLLDFMIAVPEVLSPVAVFALEQDIEPDYAIALARARKLPPPADQAISDRWPWRVRLYSLGGWRVDVDGRPIIFKSKAQQRPMLVLKCLLARGGGPVFADAIADELWPDAEGDSARHALDTALYRLRKLLDVPGAVKLANNQLVIDRRLVWSDVDYLEQIALRGPSSEFDVESRRLNKGSFLPGDDLPSVLAKRTSLSTGSSLKFASRPTNI